MADALGLGPSIARCVGSSPTQGTMENNPLAVFSECPQCGHELSEEHAHYKCTKCGWRDSCCD